jgi:hypothetical protein
VILRWRRGRRWASACLACGSSARRGHGPSVWAVTLRTLLRVVDWLPLPTLQRDDNFASDLRTLSSDAHRVGPDLATTKSDAALGDGPGNAPAQISHISSK